jgi:hypothetical protein
MAMNFIVWKDSQTKHKKTGGDYIYTLHVRKKTDGVYIRLFITYLS